MGFSGLCSTDYDAGVRALHDSGKAFARSAAVAADGDYSTVADKIAESLDPRKLKNGMRECCYAPGYTDVLALAIAIDLTGSMSQVPYDLQKELGNIIDLVVKQGISEHPSVLFMGYDDENVVPGAAFQISQFESGTKELTDSLNEMIVPHKGGANEGESYHLAFYAAARHTRLEAFEKEGKKGLLVVICDEQPCFDNGNPKVKGTTPEIAKELFGDDIQKEVPMIQSVKEANERYDILVIRPGHTQNGRNKAITKQWQKLLEDAGANPQHVLEVEETKDILPTIAMAVGRLAGADADELVDVLKAKGVDASAAAKATKAIVPFGGAELAGVGAATGALETGGKGRKR